MKPERGRGRGKGRGRGRGRGRGKGSTNKGEDIHTTNKRTSSKSRASKDNKVSEEDQRKADYYSWYNAVWESEYGPEGEEWAHDWWGTTESRWDGYAWLDGQDSLHKIAPNAKAKQHAAESAESSKKKKQKVKDTASASVAGKGPDQSGGSMQSTAPNKKKKQPRQEELIQEQPPKKPKKTKTPQTAEETGDGLELPKEAQFYMQDEKYSKQIRKYTEQFASDTSTEVTAEIKETMRSKLKIGSLQDSRLNIYWKKGGCGVTSHSQGRDLSSFLFPHVEGLSFMARLAATVKCAEMFAAWAHQLVWQLQELFCS